MMINHSTLEYHVTNFNTSLDGSGGKIKTLTLYSDPNHNPNQNPNPNHNQNPNTNEKFDFLPFKWPCHVMSRDRSSFFCAYNWS